MGQTVTLDIGCGRTAMGYFAEAADSRAPGVVVIQEWWGVQSQIKSVCDRYACEGYTAIAPDLYGGKAIPYHDEESAAQAMNALDFLAATDEIVGTAAGFLRAGGRKVGLTGFCLGGVVSILGAIRLNNVDAASAYYGAPDDSLDDAAKVRAPIQAHFASGDDWCTPADADRMERKFEQSGTSHRVFRYECLHGFANEDAKEYDKVAAETAWRRDLEWWDVHLRRVA
jgi:carboxymethylenebutenolidase